MASKAKPNEPALQPIIVKKIIVEGHSGHHGGAWKVAYADFVTAMMAFFLLMWLLGATTEKQRKALADYFTPTLVEMKKGSAGSNGMFGGDSLTSKDNYPSKASQTGTRSITIPKDSTGTADKGGKDEMDRDRKQFAELKRRLKEILKNNKQLKKFDKNIRFTETREGLRIDLVDESDFTMFNLATDKLTTRARALIGEVALVVNGLQNALIIRGHTDSLPYASDKNMNNWMLSTARAEATRRELFVNGVSHDRFERIEGVADKEPYNPKDKYDSRNRRMSITLGWTRPKRSRAKNLGIKTVDAGNETLK